MECEGFYGITNSNYTQRRNRLEISKLIHGLDPDIVCMQEFNDRVFQGEQRNNIDLLRIITDIIFFKGL